MFRVAAREEAPFWAVLDDAGQEVAVIAWYLGYVATRGFLRHTVRAYAYDMLAFWRWIEAMRKGVWHIKTEDLLGYIKWEKRRENPQRPGRNVHRLEDGRAGGVAAATINRRLAAIYGFYEHLMRIDPDGLPRNPVPRGQVSHAWTPGYSATSGGASRGARCASGPAALAARPHPSRGGTPRWELSQL